MRSVGVSMKSLELRTQNSEKASWIVRTFVWHKKLVEEDSEPSLTRYALAISIIVQIIVVFWHCYAPGIVNEHIVSIFNNTLLFLAGIWGVRGIASDIIEKIKEMGK